MTTNIIEFPIEPSVDTASLLDELVFSNGKQPVTTSIIVSVAFKRRHDNILRAITDLHCSKEFCDKNFKEVGYIDAQGKKRPAYEMTRDGFVFLCMGLTGNLAGKVKESFITAFSQIEFNHFQLPVLYKKFKKDYEFLEFINNADHEYLIKANDICIKENGVDLLALHGYAKKDDKQ